MILCWYQHIWYAKMTLGQEYDERRQHITKSYFNVHILHIHHTYLAQIKLKAKVKLDNFTLHSMRIIVSRGLIFNEDKSLFASTSRANWYY